MNIINTRANQFYNTFYTKTWSGEMTPPMADLSLTEAYQIQDKVAEKRINNGECVVGYKVGCTSQAIRTQFGLEEPIRARMFAPYIYEEGAEFDWRDYLNCAIEPEMVIKIGKDLAEENLPDAALIDAIAYVSPGIEIHNFKFWFSPPTSQELIASGGIWAGLVIGNQQVSPHTLLFSDEIFYVFKDDRLITQAPASEIMGGPLMSLRWLVNSLVKQGLVLEKDSWVIPGSPVELVPIDQDTRLTIEIERVGRLTALFK
ncbi:MAG: hypothetical protein AAF639_32370 [Chloroflexota bacterium]